MRELSKEVGSEPNAIRDAQKKGRDAFDLAKSLTEFNSRHREWRDRLNASYRLRFAKKIEDIRLTIGAMDVEKTTQTKADLWSLEVIPQKRVQSAQDVENIIAALQRLFLYLDGHTK